MTFRGFCLLGLVLSPWLVFAQAPAKLVVKNAYILTMAQDQREPVKGYLVMGDDGRLSAVAAGDPPADLRSKESLDAGGHWVFPGFISAHSHLWQSAFRGLGSDQTLLGWIDALYKPAVKASPEDMYWFTLDGALDHLQHGVTTAYASLVFVAGERDLERVYVGGDLLVQNGALLKQGISKVRAEVNQRVGALC
jgi:5-methylthioadenosine/S-adenosylhomocysteine deaminase